MSEYRALLEQARRQFPPPDITVETIADRGRRRQRNRRAGAIVMALTLLAGALAGLKALGDIRPGPRPADLPSAPESWSRVWIEQTPAGEDGFARPQEVFVAGSRLVAWGIRTPAVIRPGEPASDPAAWEST
ncbi:MAG TPA: hypothetical protein VM638_06080, partial [Actinomycetota bacterium]|nr:hypothetical protein [Actinomycetota bacterium]